MRNEQICYSPPRTKKKIFMLVWWCHQFLSEFLANEPLAPDVTSFICQLMIRVMRWNRELCTDFLAFPRRTADRIPSNEGWKTSHQLKCGPLTPNKYQLYRIEYPQGLRLNTVNPEYIEIIKWKYSQCNFRQFRLLEIQSEEKGTRWGKKTTYKSCVLNKIDKIKRREKYIHRRPAVSVPPAPSLSSWIS